MRWGGVSRTMATPAIALAVEQHNMPPTSSNTTSNTSLQGVLPHKSGLKTLMTMSMDQHTSSTHSPLSTSSLQQRLHPLSPLPPLPPERQMLSRTLFTFYWEQLASHLVGSARAFPALTGPEISSEVSCGRGILSVRLKY
jgi:hypothetical protein